MRLITHNMLKSNIKGVEKGYPLGIEVLKKEEQELEFNAGSYKLDKWRSIWSPSGHHRKHPLCLLACCF